MRRKREEKGGGEGGGEGRGRGKERKGEGVTFHSVKLSCITKK